MVVNIDANIRSLREHVPPGIRIVAVSKKKPVDAIIEAYNAGQRCFGENRVQELLQKKDLLPADIEWHLIGHLQTNKVRSIIPFVSMIESVDTLKLLVIIDSEAARVPRIIDCLLQIHIAKEESKFGFNPGEIHEMFRRNPPGDYKNVRICGVMGMATFTDNLTQIRNEFRYLSECFKEIKSRHFTDQIYFKEVSMGMSGDYLIATEEGSTIIRIGSLIFGNRN